MKLNFFLVLVILFFLSTNLFSQERYELESIEFQGNDEISSSRLSDVIYSEETPWWFWKFLNTVVSSLGASPVYFDSSNISIDISALKQFYNTNGFFEAEFDYKYNVDTTDKDVTLTYIIKENDPALFSNIKLHGLDTLNSLIRQYVEEDFEIDTTSRYNQEEVQNEIDNSENIMLNNGYMTSQYDSTLVLQDTIKNLAKIDIYFSPGKRYKIDTFLVNKDGPGASQVSEILLLDITGINSGEYYNLDKIRRSQVRLYRTGLFNSVILSSIEKDTTGHKVPLRLEGTIGLMNELSPEIILNNQQNAFNVGLGATYIRKNFLGEARKLTLSATFGIQDIYNVDFGTLFDRFSLRDTTLLGYVESRLTIEQPYLFNRPIFGIWENYANVNKQRRTSYTVYGSKLTFDFELPTYTFINHLSTSYNVEYLKEIYYTHNDSLSEKLISVIGADLRRTTANDILYPTQGYNLSLHLEEANSFPYLFAKLTGSDYKGALFYKLVATGSYYFPLDARNRAIIAAKLKVGHLQAYEGSYGGIPINRTFYTGGSNSIRGWQANAIPGINVKGLTRLFESSIEYRNKLINNFGIALFADFGNVWLKWDKFRWDNIAIAAGFGFRYYSPVAPFRLDFGFKFYDPADHEFIFKKPFWKNFEFHFGIGEAF